VEETITVITDGGRLTRFALLGFRFTPFQTHSPGALLRISDVYLANLTFFIIT
jgi:hypothetical protein